MQKNPNDVAILSFPGASQEFIERITEVISENHLLDTGLVLVTAEELKVIDLSKLDSQLRELLAVVEAIQKTKEAIHDYEQRSKA